MIRRDVPLISIYGYPGDEVVGRFLLRWLAKGSATDVFFTREVCGWLGYRLLGWLLCNLGGRLFLGRLGSVGDFGRRGWLVDFQLFSLVFFLKKKLSLTFPYEVRIPWRNWAIRNWSTLQEALFPGVLIP